MKKVRDSNESVISLTTWSDVRDIVKHLNKQLFDSIEALCPDDNLRMYKVSYEYGELIIDKGRVCLPNGLRKMRYLADEADKSLVDDLSYRSIPLALVLHNGAEVFVDDGQHTVPVRILNPGELFGLFEFFDGANNQTTASVTSVSSGARSAFMLPKISDSLSYKRLVKTYHLKSPLPKNIFEHSAVFSELAHNLDPPSTWRCTVLFFSKNWLIEKSQDMSWQLFYNHLFSMAWFQSQYLRTHTAFALFWKKFINALLERNLRPRPLQTDTIKHLLFIATGLVPGFRPVGKDESLMPSEILQNIYSDVYKIKSHLPILMQPGHYYGNLSDQPVYYSLSFPTLIESSLNPRQQPTIMEDLREISYLLEVLKDNFSQTDDQLVKIFHDSVFNCFHCDNDIYNRILPAANMPAIDKRFAENWICDSMKTFPSVAPFLRGCIGIYPRKNSK